MNRSEEVVFGYLWKSRAPLKVLAFVWTMLLNRVPTTENLAVRGVLEAESSLNFVFCGSREESVIHLFLHCVEVQRVWHLLMCWLDFHFIIPNNLFVHLECWSQEVSSKKVRHGQRRS